MKSVVLEGISSAGKTGLIASLKAKLKRHGGFDVKELSHVDSGDQFARFLREYANSDRLLFHRSHISEHVLGNSLRGQSPFADEELTTLNAVLRLRFICVLVEPVDYESFMARVSQDNVHPRESFDNAQYSKIVTSFRSAFDDIPHVHYVSSSVEELENTADAIIAKMTQA